MRRNKFLPMALISTLIIGLTIIPVLAVAKPDKPPKRVVKLKLESPKKAGKPSIQFRAGWPLIFRITVAHKDMVGIGNVGGPQTDGFARFPEINQGGAIVLANPDDCWAWSENGECLSYDETIIDFFPDRGDLRGVPDVTGQAAGFGGHLTVYDVLENPSFRPAYGGPFLYGEFPLETEYIRDGFGWGADDDIPGLVILANVGGGVVRQDENYVAPCEIGPCVSLDYFPGQPGFWNLAVPAGARNAAGFMSSVGYELTTTLNETSIVATMVVPRHLFSETRLIDFCTGVVPNPDAELPICPDGVTQRIGSGPVTAFVKLSNFTSTVELRAFVVAPITMNPDGSPTYKTINILSDLNDDGIVSAKDAELAGFSVLSNEVVFSFIQYANYTGAPNECNGGETPTTGGGGPRGTDVFVDLDGNGFSTPFSAICPLGNGGTEFPPR